MGEENDSRPQDESELLQWAKQTQRNLDFIAQQQAQFSVDLQRSREEFNERWATTEQGIRALLAIAEMHAQEIAELRASQAQTDRQMAETDRRMAETDERMKETDERINALVNFVERFVSDKREGGG